MKSLRFLLLAMLAPLGACAADATPEGDESLGSRSDALCRSGHCLPPTLPTIPVVSPVVTLSSVDLNFNLQTLLRNSVISIDTTQSSPQVFGPPTSYPNPVFVQCQQDRAACNQQPLYLRKMCLAEVNERCAGVPQSVVTNEIEHSYFLFSPQAKAYGAKDIFFPLQTLHHDDEIFSFDIDLNYIHTTIGYNLTATYLPGPTPTDAPGAQISLTGLTSNSPTVKLSNSFPDFDITNMAASVSLTGLVPTQDGQGIDYTWVGSTFSFDWNANNFPDPLVSAIIDVDQLVKDRVTTRLNNTFRKDETRAAIVKALTGMFNLEVVKTFPAGAASITAVESDPAGIRVTFVPK